MKKLIYIVFFYSCFSFSQHHSKLIVEVDDEKKMLTVLQELTFHNNSNDTLTNIVLNDWNNAYTSKNTPLAKRFSDEFERSFHLANERERGRNSNITILDQNKTFLAWEKDESSPDIIQIRLREKILPNQKVTFTLTYFIKIPSDKFTKYGFGDNGKMILKNIFLTPARYENKNFIKYDNLNLDDCANGISDFDIQFKIRSSLFLHSDLNEVAKTTKNNITTYSLKGKNRLEVNIFIQDKNDFSNYKNNNVEVVSNLRDNRLNDLQRALIIDKIVNYVSNNLGNYPHEKIMVSQVDYDRNPFYGLNQLPVFISPFPDEFLYEIKFIKTYLNNYLRTTLQLDPRKDHWIFDGIQIYIMMKYIEEFYPDAKMMGNLAKLKLLKGYNMVSLDFNGQYSYFYMLMARKNLDQPLGDPKNTLIKFNEKIASKYRAGLSLKYLDSYLGNTIVGNSIKEFVLKNKTQQTNRKDFETLLTQNSPKKINWFFNTIIESREIIDYKFENVARTKDSVSFSLKNKTNTHVPISIYGIKDKKIVFKEWIDIFKKDSTYKFTRNGAEKIIINYENQVPEMNLRNNWYSLRGFKLNNRPIKFNFMKDLEDPNYNQILYVPTIEYNLYDGLLLGFRFHNKTILDKPFIFDINPSLSTKTMTFSGKGGFYYNQFNRDSNLYNIRYQLSGQYLQYAPNAYYTRYSPAVVFNIRPDDFRDNKKSGVIIKQIIVEREKSEFITAENTQNYSIFNAKYYNVKTETAKHFNFLADFQYSKDFGKLATEIQYRRLFDNNKQLNLRLFAGTFIFNETNTDFFDFGLDRPSDYLFESEYYGRSETTGFFSQQSIVADGFFKSKLKNRFASSFMITTNASYSIWNWVEAYADLGMIKSKSDKPEFVYDSGIRLNLLTDYFEVYLPVYSKNGWEMAQPNYAEKVRFIITFSPNTLMSLFTRKWF